MLNIWGYGLVLAFILFGGATASDDREISVSDHFAEINGQIVTVGLLAERLRAEYRKKFYHGQPPAEEVAAFQDEIIQRVIDEVLLVDEAKKRDLSAEKAYMDEQFRARTAEFTEEQLTEQAEFVARLKKRIEEERLLELLEQSVRDSVAAPNDALILDYYRKYPEKFTTPAKDHVKIILLGVPAYAGSESWAAAREKAAELLKELRAGADFSEMAMIHSSDESASNGGDMGFIHSGMLGGAGEQIVSIMSPGEISEPVMLLEGVAIFELVERSDAVLNSFEHVKERAGNLLMRELKDNAWNGLIESLRQDGNVIINESLLSSFRGE